jgi:hypothetical protein
MHMTVRRRKLAALVACLVAPITAIPTLSENVAKHTGIAEASLRIAGATAAIGTLLVLAILKGWEQAW